LGEQGEWEAEGANRKRLMMGKAVSASAQHCGHLSILDLRTRPPAKLAAASAGAAGEEEAMAASPYSTRARSGLQGQPPHPRAKAPAGPAAASATKGARFPLRAVKPGGVGAATEEARER